MRLSRNNFSVGGGRRGMTMVYTVIAMFIMIGFCSLSVDLGRVQAVKTELRRAVNAAARAAVANLSTSSSAAKTAAINVAALNQVNGLPCTLTNSNITVGTWNISTRAFTSGGTANNTTTFPAVKVNGLCTKANGNPVPLLFAQVLGIPTCDVTASAVGMINQVSTTVTINATSNPWMAGEPAGTQGSEPDPGYANNDHQWKYDIAGPYGGNMATKLYSTDYATGEPYTSPQAANITLVPGSTITISNVSGTVSNDGLTSPNYNADGVNGGSQMAYSDDAATNPNAPGYTGNSNGGVAGSEFGIANISTPIDSLNAVFLDGNVPSTEGTAPPGLDFSSSSAQNYSTLSPLTRQPFFVGNGQNSGGTQQEIIVPADATRIFFGIMDGHEWSNNLGSFTATITQTSISIVQ